MTHCQQRIRKATLCSRTVPAIVHSWGVESRAIFTEMTGGPQLLCIKTTPVLHCSQSAVRATGQHESEAVVSARCLERCQMLWGVKSMLFIGQPQHFPGLFTCGTYLPWYSANFFHMFPFGHWIPFDSKVWIITRWYPHVYLHSVGSLPSPFFCHEISHVTCLDRCLTQSKAEVSAVISYDSGLGLCHRHAHK